MFNNPKSWTPSRPAKYSAPKSFICSKDTTQLEGILGVGGKGGVGRKELVPIPPARGAPAHAGEQRVRGSVTSSRTPAQFSPTSREVWQEEGPRSGPRASAGSDRPAPASGQFHKQETVPERRCPDSRPTWSRGGGASPRTKHLGQLQQWVLGWALCTVGGRGEKVSRLNKEAEGGDSWAPPLPGSPALETPFAGVQPPSLPHRLRQSLLQIHPSGKTVIRESSSVAWPVSRGTEFRPTPCPDNTPPSTDAQLPQLCWAPELSIQEAPPQQAPVTKWGGGCNQRIVFSLPDSLLLSPTFFRLQCPSPGWGQDRSRSRGWGVGTPTPPAKSQPRTKKPRDPRQAHSPCRRCASTSPRRHGPVRTGRGGGLRTCLQRSGTRRLSGAPGPASDPSPPLPPPAASASQPELHPARCTPTLQLGRSAGPSSPAPLRAPLPPQPRLKQTPCFCFEFSTPPRGRGTWLPAEGSQASAKDFEKESRLYATVPSRICALLPSPLLCRATLLIPGRRVDSGSRLSATDPEERRERSDRFERRKEIVSGRIAPFKGPHLFCFRCFEKSAQSSQLSDWILVERSECWASDALSNLDWLTD